MGNVQHVPFADRDLAVIWAKGADGRASNAGGTWKGAGAPNFPIATGDASTLSISGNEACNPVPKWAVTH